MSGRGAHYVPQVKDVYKREVAFTVVPSHFGKAGKTRSYLARLTHNQVLDEDAVVSEMCEEFNLPKNRVVSRSSRSAITLYRGFGRAIR